RSSDLITAPFFFRVCEIALDAKRPASHKVPSNRRGTERQLLGFTLGALKCRQAYRPGERAPLHLAPRARFQTEIGAADAAPHVCGRVPERTRISSLRAAHCKNAAMTVL